MASIIANDVFRDIDNIAHSVAPLPERRDKAARRIDQFRVNVAAQRRRPEVAEILINDLRKKLEMAAMHRETPGDRKSVFMEAFDRLTGFEG